MAGAGGVIAAGFVGRVGTGAGAGAGGAGAGGGLVAGFVGGTEEVRFGIDEVAGFVWGAGEARVSGTGSGAEVMHSGQTFLKVSPHGKLQSGFPTNLNLKGFGTALGFSSSSHPSFLQRYPHPPPHRWFPRFLSSSDLGSKHKKGLGTSGVTN